MDKRGDHGSSIGTDLSQSRNVGNVVLIAFLLVAPIAILGLFRIGSRIDPQTGRWRSKNQEKMNAVALVSQSWRKKCTAPYSAGAESVGSSIVGDTTLDRATNHDPQIARKIGSI